MTKRKTTPPKPRPVSWDVETVIQVNGREVRPGTEITFQDYGGQRRRARFVERVSTPGGSWVTAIELDRDGAGRSWRSFSEEKIRTVHRKSKGQKARPKKGRR